MYHSVVQGTGIKLSNNVMMGLTLSPPVPHPPSPPWGRREGGRGEAQAPLPPPPPPNPFRIPCSSKWTPF